MGLSAYAACACGQTSTLVSRNYSLLVSHVCRYVATGEVEVANYK